MSSIKINSEKLVILNRIQLFTFLANRPSLVTRVVYYCRLPAVTHRSQMATYNIGPVPESRLLTTPFIEIRPLTFCGILLTEKSR